MFQNSNCFRKQSRIRKYDNYVLNNFTEFPFDGNFHQHRNLLAVTYFIA